MDNSTEFNELLVKKNLQDSGSAIVLNRDSLAIQADIQNPSEGYVFAPTKRPIYNTDELKKVIDVTVSELRPSSLETETDLVPGPIYRATVEQLDTALATIEEQLTLISELEDKIAQLESVIANLQQQVDNAQLLQILAESTAASLREQNALLADSISGYMQRATLEGIEKSTLSSRNEGLFAQVQALKSEIITLREQVQKQEDQLAGKEAQITAGAKSGETFTVRVLTKSDDSLSDLAFNRKAKGSDNGRWINGPDIELFNFSEQTITIKLSQNKIDFLKLDSVSSIILTKGQKKQIKLEVDDGKTFDYKPKRSTGFGGDKRYKGDLVFSAGNDTVSLSLELQKQRGTKFNP